MKIPRIPTVSQAITDTAAFTTGLQAPAEADITMSRFEYVTMLSGIEKLQTGADRYLPVEIAEIRAKDTGQIDDLKNTYTKRYFMDSPYSEDALKKLATVLLEVTDSRYPGNALWVGITHGDIPTEKQNAPVFTKPPVKGFKKDA